MNIFDFFRDKGFIQVIYIFTTWFLTALVLSWLASIGEKSNQLNAVLETLIEDRSYEIIGLMGMLVIGFSIILNSVQIHDDTRMRAIRWLSDFLSEAGKNLAFVPSSLAAFVIGLIVFSSGGQDDTQITGLVVLASAVFLCFGSLAWTAIIADPKSGSRYSDRLYGAQPKYRYMIGTVIILVAFCIIWIMAHTAPNP